MNLIDRRLGLLFASFVVLLALVLIRATWLQAVEGSGYRADAHSQQTETVMVPGVRGAILDRNGKALAVSEEAASVFATPYQVEDPPAAAAKLAGVLGVDQDKLLEQLADPDSGFEYLARKVDLPTAERIEKLELAGIGLLPDSRRIYPEGELASQVIGTAGIDNQGLTGLEASEEEILHGDDGEREITRDALGDELERDTIAAAARGSDIRLTLDAAIQATTERVINEIGETFEPEGATAIVMDPRTSEVLAMANWPASIRTRSTSPSPRTSRTWPPASRSSPVRPSRRSPWRARSRRGSSNRRPRSGCRRRSRSPTARSKRRIRAARRR